MISKLYKNDWVRIVTDFLRIRISIYFDRLFPVGVTRLGVVGGAWAYRCNEARWEHATSPFFDNHYYFVASPDVKAAGLEPISHYLKHGRQELRSPSPYFDAERFAEEHSQFSRTQSDLAEVCLRLYGSYAWKVDGKTAPVVIDDLTQATKPFSRRELRVLFKRWRKYRTHFDADFYLKEYPETASTPNDAFVHYMHQGFSEDRQPRPDFDGYNYRRKKKLSRSQNPFRDCIDRLEKHSELFLPYTGDSLILKPSPEPREGNSSLCVHIHCFYIDLLPEIADLLKNINTSFSVVVTVCREKDVTAAEEILSNVISCNEIRILIVENRGRDIAPFLLDASVVWARSDFVLHLHTKRSPHISWGDNWRRYLYDKTIGGPNHLNEILRYFENNPIVGAMYPENYGMIRYFTEQNNNNNLISRISETLGLSQNGEYDEYPAGSMAFYRVSALQGLVDSDLLKGLFEEEQAQLDGTAAHALERLMPEVVRQSGYEVRAYKI
ncbi:rhamnan synthesis F family protein [Neorhizobium lilium]|nr:rhamnan synthesis F family protein [Neorhizobium lilium]